MFIYTVEPLLRGQGDQRPTSLDSVNLNKNILISSPDERAPHLKVHISDDKEVYHYTHTHTHTQT